MIPVAVNTKATAEFKKHKDKILRLVSEVAQAIPLPPQYQGVIVWADLKNDVKAKLPELKDELPEMIRKCTEILSMTGVDGGFGTEQICSCVQYIGEKLKTNLFELGFFIGLIRSELQNPYYYEVLPQAIQQIINILNE